MACKCRFNALGHFIVCQEAKIGMGIFEEQQHIAAAVRRLDREAAHIPTNDEVEAAAGAAPARTGLSFRHGARWMQEQRLPADTTAIAALAALRDLVPVDFEISIPSTYALCRIYRAAGRLLYGADSPTHGLQRGKPLPYPLNDEDIEDYRAAYLRWLGDDRASRSESWAAWQAALAWRHAREGPAICGFVSNSGPNGEPLACGYGRGHDGAHSWSALPTWPEPVDDVCDMAWEDWCTTHPPANDYGRDVWRAAWKQALKWEA